MGGRRGFTTRKTWKRWNHREKAHPPHPQHNRHSDKQDEDGARPSAPHQHPLEHQLTRQPHFKPHAHRDQDVGTQGRTSPDVDKSATPHARPPQPKAKYSLWFGSQPSAHTPAHTGPQLPCCIRLPSACTQPRAGYTTVVRAYGTHTPRVAGVHRGNRSLARRAQGPLQAPGMESRASSGEDAWPGARILRAPPPAHCETPVSHVPRACFPTYKGRSPSTFMIQIPLSLHATQHPLNHHQHPPFP